MIIIIIMSHDLQAHEWADPSALVSAKGDAWLTAVLLSGSLCSGNFSHEVDVSRKLWWHLKRSKYGNARKNSLLAGASISSKSTVSARHSHNRNEQPAGVEQELGMSLHNFSIKALLFSFKPHSSMSWVSLIGEAWQACCPVEVAEFHPETYYLKGSYSNLQCGKQQLLYSRGKWSSYSRSGSEAECCIKIKLCGKLKETEVTTLANQWGLWKHLQPLWKVYFSILRYFKVCYTNAKIAQKPQHSSQKFFIQELSRLILT